MREPDPYHDRKLYHMADKINARGGVSALCYAEPRVINLRRARWTLRPEAVTCPACRKKLEERPA